MRGEKRFWGSTAARVVTTVLVGLVVGWAFGNFWAGLAIALAGDLAWQLLNLFRLDWWVRHRSFADPPEFTGVWGEVITQVVRLHRRKRYHKKRFVQLMRQVQRSTAALPDGVVILNNQREIAWFNRTAGRLLNLRGSDDHGVRIDNLLRQPQFAHYVASGDYTNAIVLQPDVGHDNYLSMQLVPYGEGQHLLLVRDVSRQMRLENMRKDFVANASHELRSPLSVITGYLETLAHDAALPEDLQPPVSEMRRQAARMTSIIHDLLTLSRLEERNEAASAAHAIDVAALLAVLKKDVLARPTHPRDVRVTVESGARLRGDETEIHSAFSNLVDNAAKYTAAEGRIEMRWWVDEEGGHFSVTDTGMGIPAEHIPRLTERFYRVDEGRSRQTGGSGLGLAIVKHVLERHGATLDIRSSLGHGSTFACHFPLERLSDENGEAQVAERAVAVSGTRATGSVIRMK